MGSNSAKTNYKARARQTEVSGTGAEFEIDLKDLFFRCLAAWKLFVIVTLIGGALAFCYTYFLIAPKYEATATIYLVNLKDESYGATISDLQIGTALTQDYIKIFDLWDIHHEVAENLQLPYSEASLKSRLTVKNESGTRLLGLTVRTTNPTEAAVIANEYAEVASRFISERMATDEPRIVSYANVPTNPVGPSKTRNTVIGLLAGFLLVFVVVFLRMVFDDKIRTAEDIRKCTGLINLAIVPKDESEQTTKKSNAKTAGRKK
ncbi:MAG: hypothetical protein IJP98_03505 [Clostridia bacterium]|nr:hypothetical protein [Clostridia bacterium]